MSLQTEYDSQPPKQSWIKRLTNTPQGNVYADAGQFVTDEFGHAYQKRSGPTSNTGWLRLRAVQMYDILTDLPDEDCHLDGDIALVLGGAAAFDESGGIWVYQSDCELADDGHAVIKPDDVDADDPGRWRLFDDQWFST